LEVHIPGFDKNIYGESIKVYFKTLIREEKRFDNLDELKAAMAFDIQYMLSLKL